MSATFIVTGTDTDVGKTVFASALLGAIDGYYWKPVQAGVQPGTDSAQVHKLSGVARERILPEAYRLLTPCSPHLAAEKDGLLIDIDKLALPDVPGPLIVEGAGGAFVPLTRQQVYADQFIRWQKPVIIVARTALGTINHSLLTIEALRSRGITIQGIAFVGDTRPDSENIICALGGVKRLGCLPLLQELSAANLRAAFLDNFDVADFQG